MKKLITLLLVFCLWVPLAGFTSVSSGAIMYTNGQVKEVISITISSLDAAAVGKTLEQLTDAVQSVMPMVKLDVQTAFQNKVNNDPDIDKITFQNAITIDATLQQDEGAAQVGLVITYKTRAHWQYFCNTEAIETQTKSNLFITNTITTSPLRLAIFDDNGSQKNTLQFVYDNLTMRLENYVGDIENIMSTKYVFTYALKANRLHSDADLVEHDTASGLTYYTWQFAFTDTPQITFWQTRANVISWYVLALVITGGLGLVLWFVAKNKKPPEEKLE